MNLYNATITIKNFRWEETAVRLHFYHLTYEEADRLFLKLQEGCADKKAITMHLKADNRRIFSDYVIIKRKVRD